MFINESSPRAEPIANSCLPKSATGQGLRESQPSRAATVSWPTLRKWTSADQRAAGATEYGWKSDPEQKFQEPQRRNRADRNEFRIRNELK